MLRVLFVGIRLDNEKTIRDIYHSVVEQIENNIYYSCNLEAPLQYIPLEGGLNINFLQVLKSLDSRGNLSWIPEDMTKEKEYADNLLDMGILDGEYGCSLLLEYNAAKYKEETIDKFKELFVKTAIDLTENINNPKITIEEIRKKFI